MQIGIVDLGTNSVRFALYQKDSAELSCLYKKKLMLRPGQGVYKTGRLKKSTIRKLTSAFLKFSRLAQKAKVETIYAAATSALREAQNSKKVIERIYAKTGIRIHIISGPLEARLIAQGITHFDPPAQSNFTLIDIGGGSTEISIFRNRKSQCALSLPLGALRLQQVFLSWPQNRQIEYRLASLSQMRHWTAVELKRHLGSWKNRSGDVVIGSSGTVRALGRILDPRLIRQSAVLKGEAKSLLHLKFQRRDLRQLIEEMLFMNKTEFLRLPGMEARRIDIIFSGAVLLYELLEFLDIKKVQTTHCGLRDGLLLYGLSKMK